jgi:hypothetical protein
MGLNGLGRRFAPTRNGPAKPPTSFRYFNNMTITGPHAVSRMFPTAYGTV